MKNQPSREVISLATRYGLDLDQIEGSGKNGLVLEADVRAIIDQIESRRAAQLADDEAERTLREEARLAALQAEESAAAPDPIEAEEIGGSTQVDPSAIEDLTEDEPVPVEVSEGAGIAEEAPEDPAPEAVPEPTQESDPAQEEAEEPQETAESKKVEVVSEPAPIPSRPVQERSILAFLTRRTGLPITAQCAVMDQDPIHLVDTLVPVVATRTRDCSMESSKRILNPVIPSAMFEEIVGPTSAREDYVHRIGMFSLDGLAKDRLRYAGLATELGEKAATVRQQRLDQAARNWVLAVIANPDIHPGGYLLRSDIHGAEYRPSLRQNDRRGQTRPQILASCLGMPDLETLALDRFQGDDKVMGEAFHPMAAELLRRAPGFHVGSNGFVRPKVSAIYTQMDVETIFRGSKEGERHFNDLLSSGKISPHGFRAGNWNDWALGKFILGLHISAPELVARFVGHMNDADRIVQEGWTADRAGLAKQKACAALVPMITHHIESVLAPRVIDAAMRKESRVSGNQITRSTLDRLSPEGPFGLQTLRAVAQGIHPQQSKIRKDIVKACRVADSWIADCMEDIRAAISGLSGYFTNRTPSGMVTGYMVQAPLDEIRGPIMKSLGGVRPSFFVMNAPGIQVVNKSFGEYLPSTLSEMFA